MHKRNRKITILMNSYDQLLILILLLKRVKVPLLCLSYYLLNRRSSVFPPTPGKFMLLELEVLTSSTPGEER